MTRCIVDRLIEVSGELSGELSGRLLLTSEVVCYVDCMRKLCSVEVVGSVGHVTWRSLTSYRESLGKDDRVVREFKGLGFEMAERRYPATWSTLLEDGRVQEFVRVKKL